MLVSITLFLTVLSSVGLGIFFAHAAIHSVLHIFAPVAREASKPAPVLIVQKATAEQG